MRKPPFSNKTQIQSSTSEALANALVNYLHIDDELINFLHCIYFVLVLVKLFYIMKEILKILLHPAILII